jgi:ATP-dependent helicase/nuclease subunit B
MSAFSIFTIPPACDFIADLAEGLLADSQKRGVPLADYQVLLPTRRAGRSLRAAFTRLGGAMLLPRLLPLGELDDDALAFAEAAVSLDGETLPVAIEPMRRRLLLAQLLQKHHNADLSADGAWQLAGTLGSLLDEMQIKQLPPESLHHIVPEELAAHWQQVLQFLHIITVHWPQLLSALGLVDPVTRRNLMVQRQADLWRQHPPSTPIIAAGSTASMPATAQLLQVIAGLPHGMVILPGLDQAMPEDIWETVKNNPTHPQYTMQQWLDFCDLPRRFVQQWPQSAVVDDARTRLLQRALLPATASACWREKPDPPLPPQAAQGLSMCVAETQAEEAQLIALKLRATLAIEKRTAMVITRDRQLAARVVQALQRWDIHIDDSAGQSLASTSLGLFLQLVMAAAAPEASAVDYLALLKHPLTALGWNSDYCQTAARLTEIKFWRGHRRRGTALQQRQVLLEQSVQSVEQNQLMLELLERLGTALAPLSEVLAQSSVRLAWMVTAHLQAAEAIATTAESLGSDGVWLGEAGQAAATLFQEALAAADDFTLRIGLDYSALCRRWLTETMVHPVYAQHPRLTILGPLEARLQKADCIILAGMNEGNWPGTATLDPWLSRPMRAACTLPPPEKQIGQAAHDFVQAAARGEVMVTRARKVDGQPTVPSRFILRLETLWQALQYPAELLQPVEPWRDWAQQLDKPVQSQPMPRPCPAPSADLRPRCFSVTDVSLWRSNPYGFYAKHILRLRPLDPLDPDLSHADFGNIIHKILEEFINTQLGSVWLDQHHAVAQLLTLGQRHLQTYADEPLLQSAWTTQFHNIAAWFVATEAERRLTVTPLQTECQAILPLLVDGVRYELTGRADRIDATAQGLVVIDYKTGFVPTDKQVSSGIAPQLPLLGLMVNEGVFAGLPARSTHELLYYKISGRADAEKIDYVKDGAALIPQAREMLETMVRRYANPAMPYLVVPQPDFVPRYDDYRHLGRIDEWGLSEAGGDE